MAVCGGGDGAAIAGAGGAGGAGGATSRARCWPAFAAAQGRLPIGGDHGAYSGLDEVAAWLDARADAAPVVYQRNLGWHFQFYLFDALQAGRADLRWYPSSVALADNAAKSPHRPR